MITAGVMNYSSVHQLRGVCKKGPVVDVHLVNAKGSELIERDKAESQAMMVMDDDPEPINYKSAMKTTSYMVVTTVIGDSP